MNLFIQWGHGSVKSEALRRLLRELQVEYCGYLSFEEAPPYTMDHTEMDGLYANAPLSRYKELSSKMPPLDGELIEKMRVYEPMAMAILNRWRRSLVDKGTYAELHEAYLVFLRYCYGYIMKHNIDMLVLYAPPHIPLTYTLYTLCKAQGIPTVAQYFLPSNQTDYYGKYFTISLEEKDKAFQQRLQENLALAKGSNEDIPLHEYLETCFLNYTRANRDVKRVISDPFHFSFSNYFDRAKMYLHQKRYRTLARKIIFEGKKKQQKHILTAYEKKVSCLPSYERPYVLYLLHFQPEATTLPCGGVFVDQLLAINMLAACLPNDTELYVKEHPGYWTTMMDPDGMGEARSKVYYDDIRSIPKVKLIRHDVSSLELMDRCMALATITGTAGIEALFKGKPVLVFGNQFYTEFPGVFHIKSNAECKKAIREICEGITMPTIRELRACYKTLEPIMTVDVTDTVKTSLEDENMRKLAESAAEEYVSGLVRFVKDNYPINNSDR